MILQATASLTVQAGACTVKFTINAITGIQSMSYSAECVHALKGLALPRESHRDSGEIAFRADVHAGGSASPFSHTLLSQKPNSVKKAVLLSMKATIPYSVVPPGA